MTTTLRPRSAVPPWLRRRTNRPRPAAEPRIRSTVGASPDEFIERVQLEIERARRRNGSFCVSELVPDELLSRQELDGILGGVRAVDVAAEVDGHVLILWSDTRRAHLSSAICRVAGTTDGTVLSVRTVEFPDDCLSIDALFDALGRAEFAAVRRDGLQLGAPPSDEADAARSA